MFNFGFRSSNQAAHALARVAAFVSGLVGRVICSPTLLSSVITKDLV